MYTRRTSGTSTWVAFRRRATKLDSVISWITYPVAPKLRVVSSQSVVKVPSSLDPRSEVSDPILVRISSAAGDSGTSSSWALLTGNRQVSKQIRRERRVRTESTGSP